MALPRPNPGVDTEIVLLLYNDAAPLNLASVPGAVATTGRAARRHARSRAASRAQISFDDCGLLPNVQRTFSRCQPVCSLSHNDASSSPRIMQNAGPATGGPSGTIVMQLGPLPISGAWPSPIQNISEM